MSLRDQNVRFRFQALSELPTVIAQLEQINQLTEQQGKAANASANLVKAALANQKHEAKLQAEESLAIAKEIARQTTLEKKAQLDQQTAQLRASEAQMTAYVQASEKERAAIAEQIAKQTTNEQQAELKARLIQLEANEEQKTAVLKAEEERRTAAVRAALLEQAMVAQRMQEEATLTLRNELNQQTAIQKAEADQQTAIVRAEQQRQTMILRSELDQQRLLIRQQGAAFQELRSFIASAFGVYEVYQFSQSVIDAKSEVDRFRIGLEQMIGSKAETTKIYAQLIEMAKTTPFKVENLMEATFSLKAMGTATSELLPTLEALGNMSAVVGSDKLGRIAKAFTDVENKGRLMKQELNQFAENGVPLYDLLAVSMGKTRDEVVKMADAHQISFAQVKKAIFDASSEGGRYYNQMAIQAQTLGGQVSNLADKFFLAKAKIGDYFENGLQKTISGLSELVDVMAGSDSAITRNVAILKSAAAAWLTYLGVANSAKIAEEAVAAAMVVKNAVMAAGRLAVGTYNLMILTAAGSVDALTAAEIRSAAAARATWAALASNPLGIVIGLVGALTTAYFAYEAATTEVVTKLGEEELALRSQQQNLNAVATAAMGAAMGTKQRIDYINILKREWPEYFDGIAAEKVTNAELKVLLDKVNGSYSARISLARQAYKLEGLQDEMKKNLQKEAEILATLPADLQAKYGGKITAAVADMFANPQIFDKINTDWKGKLGFGDFSFDEAKKVSDNLERIGRAMVTVDADIAKSQGVRITMAERAENERWAVQQKSLKEGSAAYKKQEQEHLDNLDKIRENAQKKEVAQLVAHTGKLKTVTLNSALTVKDILLNTDEMSYENKVKYYQNLEKLQIEAVNKTRVSTKASEDELVALRQAALKKIEKIQTDFASIQRGLAILERQRISETIDAEIDAFQKRNEGQQAYTTKVTTSFKNIAEAAKKRVREEIAAEKELQAEREETLRLEEKADKAIEKSRTKIINLVSEFLAKDSPMLGAIGKALFTVIDHVDTLSGKTFAASKKAVDEAQANVNLLQKLYDSGMSGNLKAVEDAKQNLARLKADHAQTGLETAQSVFTVAGAVYQVLSVVRDTINAMIRETDLAIAGALKATLTAYQEFAERYQELNEEVYREDLKNFVGNEKEKLAYIRAYYKEANEFAKGKEKVQNTLSFYQKMAQIRADDSGNVKKLMEDMFRLMQDRQNDALRSEIAAAERKKQLAADERDAKIEAIDAVYQANKDALEQQIKDAKDAADKEKQVAADKRDVEIEAVSAVLDAAKTAYDTAMDAAKTAYQNATDTVRREYEAQLEIIRAQEDAERAQIQQTYDLKRALLEQSTSDQLEAIEILERPRMEALARYEADERSRIIATRDRILSTLTDEGERAAVTAAYEQQLKNLHDEVEQAKLDKTKGVSLATKQIKQEEKDETERLKKEETDTLTNLSNTFQTLFKNLADERDQKLQDLKNAEEKREADLKATLKQAEETAAADKKAINEAYALAIKTINENLATAIQGLQNAITANEQNAALAKKVAETEYANAVKQLNIEIFEANKQLMIAQLKTEVAVLEAKKTIFNDGRITDAQNQIIAIINQLLGTSSGLSPVGGLPEQITGPNAGTPIYEAFTKDGKKVVITYSKDHYITVYDAKGNEIKVKDGIGFVPETGEYFQKGTEYVDGPYRDGIDTVPAWLTKGERVLTVEQNRALGDITNEELIMRHQFLESLDLSGIGNMISLPAGIVGPDGSSTALDLSELAGEMRLTRQAIENQKLLSVNIDRNGFNLSEQGSNSIVNHWSNLLRRS